MISSYLQFFRPARSEKLDTRSSMLDGLSIDECRFKTANFVIANRLITDSDEIGFPLHHFNNICLLFSLR
jgi:hypothetical protein